MLRGDPVPRGGPPRLVVVIAAVVLVAAIATPAFGALSGVITGSGTTTSGAMVVTDTPSGGSTCTSAGGTGQFTSDTATCPGTEWSSTALSTSGGTAYNLGSTLTSAGTVDPTTATAQANISGVNVAADSAGSGDDAFTAPGTGVTSSATGPLTGGGALTFNGSTGYLETEHELTDPGPSFSLTAWFKVASGYASGGELINFQNTQSGAPTEWDRNLWLDDSGHISAGEYTSGNTQAATSTTTYNDGSWHLAVASFSASAGLKLYVDGTLVASNASATAPQTYNGWWTIGYGLLGNWSPVPASNYLAGSLAEVAVLPSALTAAQVTTLYGSGTGAESGFETRLQADGPSQFWTLQSLTASTSPAGVQICADSSGDGNDGFVENPGVTASTSGPLTGGGAVTLNGSSGMLITQQKINNPPANETFAAWFKVPSGYSSGGFILGFQNTQNPAVNAPADADRAVWMDNSGQISAAVVTSTPATDVATSPGTYNDGAWHFVVASLSASAGLIVYVDGSQVATNASATSTAGYAGYWTIGYGYGYISPVPASDNLQGSLAEVAVFPSTLSAAQVATLYDGDSGTEAAFETRARSDSPAELWTLQSITTTTNLPDVDDLPDISGNNDLGLPQSGVSPSDQGPFGSDGAMLFDGASATASLVETSTDLSALPAAFTVSVWFKAPTGLTTGGGIWNLNTSQGGSGGGSDPALTLDDSGNVVASTYSGAQYHVATSGTNYDNGAWHFAVATVSSAGLKLYVDGSLAASTSGATGGGTLGGYWQIGKGLGYSDQPTNQYWTGELAHFAYFTSALSSTQISALYAETGVGAYEAQVLADSPTYYWPMTDSGTTETATDPFFQIAPDSSGDNDHATAIGSAVTFGVPGHYSSSYAASFNGSTGYLETANSMPGPDTFSLTAWIKAPSHATGGGIIGFDQSQSGTGSSRDRAIWMDNSGKIVAGISGGSGVEATSSSTYDDNAWHLVVATFTPSSLKLYVDGSQVASVTSGISDSNYTGWWTVGFESVSWTDAPSTAEWDGSLADVAVLPTALSSATVSTLYGETSQSAFSTEVSSLSPTAFWPLAAAYSSVTDIGDIEMTAQEADNGTTTCLYPAGSGSCSSPTSASYLPTSTTSWTASAPTAGQAATITLAAEEPTAAPAPFAGLNFEVPLQFTFYNDGWTAILNYPNAALVL
jgi:hypothetical protein